MNLISIHSLRVPPTGKAEYVLRKYRKMSYKQCRNMSYTVEMKLLRAFLLLVLMGSVFKGFLGIFAFLVIFLIFLWDVQAEIAIVIIETKISTTVFHINA